MDEKKKTIKALTLYQPYAEFVVIGEKLYETRPWGTKYRGTLGIHAGLHKPKQGDPERRYYEDLLLSSNKLALPVFLDDLVFGAMIGTAELVDCIKMDAEFCRNLEDTREGAIGWFEPGRYAWELRNPVKFAEPLHMPGKQGLWDWRID